MNVYLQSHAKSWKLIQSISFSKDANFYQAWAQIKLKIVSTKNIWYEYPKALQPWKMIFIALICPKFCYFWTLFLQVAAVNFPYQWKNGSEYTTMQFTMEVVEAMNWYILNDNFLNLIKVEPLHQGKILKISSLGGESSWWPLSLHLHASHEHWWTHVQEEWSPIYYEPGTKVPT